MFKQGGDSDPLYDFSLPGREELESRKATLLAWWEPRVSPLTSVLFSTFSARRRILKPDPTYTGVQLSSQLILDHTVPYKNGRFRAWMPSRRHGKVSQTGLSGKSSLRGLKLESRLCERGSSSPPSWTSRWGSAHRCRRRCPHGRKLSSALSRHCGDAGSRLGARHPARVRSRRPNRALP